MRILVTFQTNVHYFFVYSVVPPLIFLLAFLGRLSASHLEAIQQECPGCGFHDAATRDHLEAERCARSYTSTPNGVRV